MHGDVRLKIGGCSEEEDEEAIYGGGIWLNSLGFAEILAAKW